MLFEPRPLLSQKNIGASANAINVGRLKMPRTVNVAIIKQSLSECTGNDARSL